MPHCSKSRKTHKIRRLVMLQCSITRAFWAPFPILKSNVARALDAVLPAGIRNRYCPDDPERFCWPATSLLRAKASGRDTVIAHFERYIRSVNFSAGAPCVYAQRPVPGGTTIGTKIPLGRFPSLQPDAYGAKRSAGLGRHRSVTRDL